MTAFTAAAVLLLSSAAPPAETAADANRRLAKCVNLGNALDAPSEGAWGVTLKADYFAKIKAAGFTAVRLPVRWSAHADTTSPYALDAKFAARVDWALDEAAKQDLAVVLNLHHYDELYPDPAAHKARLVGIWKQLAARYKDRPSSVVFEFLNEPNGKLTEAEWNAWIPDLLAAIRPTNPHRAVVVGPGQWNGFRALPKLVLPDDPKLIVTVHYYDPFEFTHQGAAWAKGSDKWKGRTWRNTPAEAKQLAADLDGVAKWAKAAGRPVFLGEFGAYSAADADSRVAYTAAVARAAEGRDFAWGYWEFCSGFGVYDPATDAWRGPLLNALLPKP